jgi:hypothetical protein
VHSIIGDKRLTAWLRAAGYVAIITSIIVFVVWAYVRHRGKPEPEPKPPTKKERPPLVVASWDERFTFADEREFFAPAAFPWSMSSIGRAPVAEITFVTIISEPTPEETVMTSGEAAVEAAEGVPTRAEEGGASGETKAVNYDDIIRNAVLKRIPSLAMPYELDAVPPYLVVPLEFTLDFVLGPDGLVKSATIQGDMDEALRVQIAEKAVNLRFPSVLSWFDFRCGVRLIPDHYDRIIGTRGGYRVSESEYRLLLRALQYGTSGLAETIYENAPELLLAGNDYVIEFTVDGSGRPTDTVVRPIIVEPASETAVIKAVSSMNFPPELGGTDVVIKMGS